MHNFDLLEKSIYDLQTFMADGLLTATEITQLYLDRIAQIDKSGPKINAVLAFNPDALAIASALDHERSLNGPRGSLHGIPVLLKDNIDTGDNMPTTAGSLALANSYPAQDAFLVQQLRAAGAIILGKTNLSEWANFRSTRSTSGWSSVGGQTRNPYALDRNPCGSSSGSAVAVAANLCAVAIGTETDGSIVCPAHVNGIVGLKPTVGLVSRSGIVPISHSQDTAGPMTRTVADAALLLGALTDLDTQDEVKVESQGNAHNDYAQFLDRNGLQGTRIGVARNFLGYHPAVDVIFENCLSVLKQAGAELVDPTNLTADKQFHDNELIVLLYEFKHDLNRYLASLGEKNVIQTLEDVITFNEKHADLTMPYFGQEILHMAFEKEGLANKTYIEAHQNNLRHTREEGIDALLIKHKLDAIVAPTGGPAWLTDWVNSDHYGGSSSSPAAVAGYPNITVPAGFILGLPVGISFFSKAYSEPTLIRLAYAFEQAHQARRPPKFLPSVDFAGLRK